MPKEKTGRTNHRAMGNGGVIAPTPEDTTAGHQLLPDENRKPFRGAVAARLEALRGPRSREWMADRGGVHEETYRRYEAGKVPASWEFLSRLREGEGIDLNALLDGRGAD